MQNVRHIALDTNIFIYYFEENPLFLPLAEKIFDGLQKNKFTAVTNIISLTEILSFSKLSDQITVLEQLFLETPNLTIYDVDKTIATEAARIRRKHSFRLGDAIQLATALQDRADVFITNDERLKKFTEIKVMMIGEITQTPLFYI